MDEDKIEKAIKDVEVFISHFSSGFGEIQSKFLYGQCYWFAKILEKRFTPFYYSDIIYSQIENHFYFSVRIEQCFLLFDIRGLYQKVDKLPEAFYFWDDYIAYEPLDATRVYRDCIWQMDNNQWAALSEEIRNHPWHYF